MRHFSLIVLCQLLGDGSMQTTARKSSAKDTACTWLGFIG